MAESQHVVVIGGTCFQGRVLVGELLAEGFAVSVVNRGNTYWGDADPWGGKVEFVHADRDEPAEFAQVIRATFRKIKKLCAVVDFSAFSPSQVRPLLPLLRAASCALYIVISSDSVYDTCPGPWPSTGATEDLAPHRRPTDEAQRAWLHRRHRYGDNKLRIEELLGAEGADLRWLALRLPDVLGPYEDTGRFWATLMYAALCPEHMYLSKRQYSERISVVFSLDVVRVIVDRLKAVLMLPPPDGSREILMLDDPIDCDSLSSSSSSSSTSSSYPEAPDSGPTHPPLKKLHVEPQFHGKERWMNRAFNVGCKETPTLAEFLEMISEEATGKRVSVQVASATSRKEGWGTADYFPSVDCGPVDVSQACAELGFTPTPLQSVIRATVEFFMPLFGGASRPAPYPVPDAMKEWKHALKKVPEKVQRVVLHRYPIGKR